ncbi:MAG TPA: acyl-CoA dehydrogenase family protein [Pseudolabrys sp.]|nr:acyl-CoA dehydrogenase family protein [Pseudolabrys sp.]
MLDAVDIAKPASPDQALETLRTRLPTDFRRWADDNEARGHFPAEGFRTLHELGLLHGAASEESGGLGGTVRGTRPGFYLQVMRALCNEDSAVGHCYQVHNHAVMRLEQFGTPWQIDNILRPAMSRYSVFATVGAEPGRRSNKEPMKTTASKVAGGWRVNGLKSFVTNGGHADIIQTAVRIDPENNGGVEGANFMLLIDGQAEGISWVDDWYRPNGMKAARSPLMKLDDVFVPDSHVMLPNPAREIETRWGTQIHLGFACNFLGSAEGLVNWYVDYARSRGMDAVPFTQVRTGKMRFRLQAANALFEQAIDSWRTRPVEEAEILSLSAKIFAAETASLLATETMAAAGATAQFEHLPFGRYLRNIHLHQVHMGFDRTAQILGQATFGLDYDPTILR